MGGNNAGVGAVGVAAALRRADLDWVLACVALVVAQLVLFPAPMGVVLQGTVIGLLTALVGVGMVLVYRANRVLNFAQGELGLLPTTIAVMLIIESGFPWLAGLVIGLAAAIVLGASAEFLVIRRFARSPRLVLTVATLGLAETLGFASLLVPRWWDARVASQRIDAPFDLRFEFGGLVFTDNDVLVLVITPLVLVAVGLFLRFSRAGIAIRAAAGRPERASMLGIPVRGMHTGVWALAAALAFLALFLRAGVLGLPIGGRLGVLFFLRALAAVVIGRLEDLRAVLVASVVLGIFQQAIVWNADSALEADAIMAAAIGVVILLALVVRRPGYKRADQVAETLAMGDVRALPRALARLPIVRAATVVAGVVAVLAAVAIPEVFAAQTILRVSALFIFTIGLLSLVVLTGWAGQVSLGQAGFLALGGAIGAYATQQWNADLILATLLAASVGAGAAVVVGLPALRLRGLYLAVTTLAFALATTSWVVNERFFDWVPTERVPRLPLFGRIDYSSPRGIYYVSLVALVLVLVAIQGIRKSRTGRVLVALRDNEPGVTAFGVSVVRAKLTAFAISGFLAAASGALFVHHQQTFDPVPAGAGIGLLIAAVVGGIGSILGAGLGALYYWGTFWWLEGEWRVFATGFGVLVVLLIAPGGVVGLLHQGRDAVLRWYVERRA